MLLGVQYAALQLNGAEKSVSVVKDWIYYPDGLEKFAPGCQGVERRTEKQRESVRSGCVDAYGSGMGGGGSGES
jgi:hypothetical protein